IIIPFESVLARHALTDGCRSNNCRSVQGCPGRPIACSRPSHPSALCPRRQQPGAEKPRRRVIPARLPPFISVSSSICREAAAATPPPPPPSRSHRRSALLLAPSRRGRHALAPYSPPRAPSAASSAHRGRTRSPHLGGRAGRSSARPCRSVA
ncbi:hypothetical protein PAHAL_1G034200, partial [Panicum hallii]